MKKLECKKCGYVNYINDNENVFKCSLCGAKSKYPETQNIVNSQNTTTDETKHKKFLRWVTIATSIYIYLIQFLYNHNHINLPLLVALVLIPVYSLALFIILKSKELKHRLARIILVTIISLLSLIVFMLEIFS